MTRHLLTLRVTVKDGERTLILKEGRVERALGPGSHKLWDPRHRLAIESFAVIRTEFPAERYAVLKAERPELALVGRTRAACWWPLVEGGLA